MNWTENGSQVSTSASYTFTITGNRTLVANFTQITYTISTSSNPTAGGTTSGGGTFNSGASVTVTATPATGYQFVNWTESGSQVSTSASYTFTVTGNRTLVANFTQITYTVYALLKSCNMVELPVEAVLIFRSIRNSYCNTCNRLPVCELDREWLTGFNKCQLYIYGNW